MKQIRLTSCGFTRAEGYDFCDDGNSFKAYFYKGIEFSYLRKYGEIYLAGHFDDRNYAKESINMDLKEMGQEICGILNEYNGVCESYLDEEKLTEYVQRLGDVIEMINIYKKLEKSIQSVEVYKFQNNYLVNKVVEKNNFRSNYEYEIKLSIISEGELENYKRNLSIELKELIVK